VDVGAHLPRRSFQSRFKTGSNGCSARQALAAEITVLANSQRLVSSFQLDLRCVSGNCVSFNECKNTHDLRGVNVQVVALRGVAR
jgi:hypothetical protein